MNYEELLRKYMEHVRECEGTDFTHRINAGAGADVAFSKQEEEALLRISQEIQESR